MTVHTDLVLNETTASTEWTPEALKQISDHFEGRPPEEFLRWGLDTFAPDIALATALGAEDVVLIHLISQIRSETTMFYLDTDLLFAETYQLRDELAERLGVRFTRVHGGLSVADQALLHGPALWKSDPGLCCQLRKVAPLRSFLASRRAWITGIRRDQTPLRAHAGLVEWDAGNGLVKFNPLASWTSEDVWAHIRQHSLPSNPLHEQGYQSIGCEPCTRPVAPGEDPRAGRWGDLDKTECGIHVQLPEDQDGDSDAVVS